MVRAHSAFRNDSVGDSIIKDTAQAVSDPNAPSVTAKDDRRVIRENNTEMNSMR
jgi:hypothetical protein